MKKIYFLFFIILFLFQFKTSAFAGLWEVCTPTDYWYPGLDFGCSYFLCTDANSCGDTGACNKTDVCTTGTCGSVSTACCATASPWTKYNVSCTAESREITDWEGNPTSETRCFTVYTQVLESICSTADKCIDGEHGLRSGGCDCYSYSPSIYKQCCDNGSGALSALTCVPWAGSDDGKYPSEGVCPVGTFEKLISEGGCCTPVNGGWSAFSACVGGVQTRTCNNPTPSCGGSSCIGSDTQACCPAAETCIESKYGTYLPDGNCNQVLCSADPITMYFCLNTAYGSCSATSSQYAPDADGQTECNTNLETYFSSTHVGNCYAVQSSCVSNCACVPNDCAASTYVGSTCWNGCATVDGTKVVTVDPPTGCTPWTCPAVNGVCGSSFPGQCITGTNSGATLSGHYYNWSCLGSN